MKCQLCPNPATVHLTKIVNKDVKDRTEYLDPARVSHLKMLVVTLATF